MNSKYVAIIDYKMSNLFSIKNSLKSLGLNCIITSNHDEILSADGVILPGVGSFPKAMENLNKLQLIKVIKQFIAGGKPFVGICLGFHLLFSKSNEFYECEGLNIVPGKVESFKKYISKLKIPHVGWNTVQTDKINMFNNTNYNSLLDNNTYYYFVHSYFVIPESSSLIYSTTKYGNFQFCSSILKDNIFACQFHPEKSGESGIKLIKKIFL